jgi:hypothetical protein
MTTPAVSIQSGPAAVWEFLSFLAERMDALSFTPWRVPAAHAPLGDIMRARKEVYRHSSIQRHLLNGQERREPRGADEVLG